MIALRISIILILFGMLEAACRLPRLNIFEKWQVTNETNHQIMVFNETNGYKQVVTAEVHCQHGSRLRPTQTEYIVTCKKQGRGRGRGGGGGRGRGRGRRGGKGGKNEWEWDRNIPRCRVYDKIMCPYPKVDVRGRPLPIYRLKLKNTTSSREGLEKAPGDQQTYVKEARILLDHLFWVFNADLKALEDYKNQTRYIEDLCKKIGTDTVAIAVQSGKLYVAGNLFRFRCHRGKCDRHRAVKGEDVKDALQEYYDITSNESLEYLLDQDIWAVRYVFINSRDISNYKQMHAESILIENYKLQNESRIWKETLSSLSVTKPPCAKCEEYIREEFKEKQPNFITKVYSGARHNGQHTQFGADNYTKNNASWKVADWAVINREWIDLWRTPRHVFRGK